MNKMLTMLLAVFLLAHTGTTQTCPDKQVRWLKAKGRFIMDWNTNGDATTMFNSVSTIEIVDGCADNDTGNYPCNGTHLNDTQNKDKFKVVNAGSGTENRIKADDVTLWSNGNTYGSGFTGVVKFHLTDGNTVQCTYTNAALPVVLTGFTAYSHEDYVAVKWRTETELNNAYIAVEHSTDGKVFVELGKEKGNGDSIEPRDYLFEDKAPVIGQNYYRLRQVDVDGSITYSKVVTVLFKNEDKRDELNVYPSLVRNGDVLKIDLTAQRKKDIQLNVFDVNGQLVFTFETVGGDQILMPVPSLLTGMYFITINDEHIAVRSKFFVID